jgi:hypothetical protein
MVNAKTWSHEQMVQRVENFLQDAALI